MGPAIGGATGGLASVMIRIAILSTPRSGNVWVRSVLGHILELQQVAVHNPRDIPDTLQERMILQIHWYREPNFQYFLSANKFQPLVISRHPLDVLISAWRFAPFEPSTARWLEGNAELPADIIKYPPASPAFVSYATSYGAENLLSVSYQWWHEPGAIRCHYEALVRNPMHVFGKLVQLFGGSTEQLTAALERYQLAVFQSSPNRHGWQGQPGLWRAMLPVTAAWRIWRRHRRIFDTLGYGPPIAGVTRSQAVRNWQRLR
jgi:hypothetical protein